MSTQTTAATIAPTAVTPVQDTPVIPATAAESMAQYAGANNADKFSVTGSVSNADHGQTKEVFNIDAVRTADLTVAMVKTAKRTQRLANSQWHYACIGAAYQVIQHGNRTPMATLLGSMGKKSQRYQKILECLRNLCGGMMTITENGAGSKATIDFEYKFDMDTKIMLLGDTDADDYDETKTEFYKRCQKPFFEYELASEDYGFDADKFFKSFETSAKKGAIGGLTIESMMAKLEEGFAAGLKEKKEKEDAEKAAAAKALANVQGHDLVSLEAARLTELAPENCQTQLAEIELVVSAHLAGDITTAAAKYRLAGAEMQIEEAIAEIAAAAANETTAA